MAGSHQAAGPVTPGNFIVSSRTKALYSVSMFIGVLSFSAALYLNRERAWHSFLVSSFYFLNLALGGLFWAAIQHVAKVGWSVNIRRVGEAFTAFLPIAIILFLAVLFGGRDLYPWLNPEMAAKDPLIQVKAAYLNMPFFVIRLVVFFGAWLIFKKLIIGSSIKQDQSGSEELSIRNVAYSVAFLLVFALSYSLFSIDAVMSLEPHFFSTIWGIYCFAGLFQSFLAAYIIFLIYMMNKGMFRGLVNENHLHDVAKFMKAFTVFYAYIAFSQFMLIWYANLPEETFFYLDRTSGGWMAATASLFILKFAVPFLLLLPRWAKRTPSHLVMVASLLLVMQYVDIHWMVYPNLDKESWLFGWQEIGVFLGFGGLFIWSVTNFLSKHNIIPLKDPRIDESTHHHVTY